MHFINVFLAAAILAVASAVQFTDPSFSGITAGQPFNITWSGATGPVTLRLKNGPATNQLLVNTIATGLTGTSFLWTPSTTTAPGTYNLEIDDSNGDINYSVQFSIIGGTASASSSASSAALSASSSISSVISSVLASITANTTTTTAVPFSNSTATRTSITSITTKAATTTPATATSSPTSSSSSPASNSAAKYGSPFALVLTAFIAFVYLA